nr:MAG TPA: hypothetical protein [Bacteriophage sp.]
MVICRPRMFSGTAQRKISKSFKRLSVRGNISKILSLYIIALDEKGIIVSIWTIYRFQRESHRFNLMG